MATTTQNLGLIKPAGTDKIRIAQINSNMDTIDAKMGPVGSTPLQTQATNAAASISALQSSMAIICNGNTHAAIASGSYAYVRNHSSLAEGLYQATAAIAANATLSTSNLTAVSGGGLNALNGKLKQITYSKLGSPTNLSSSSSFLCASDGYLYVYCANNGTSCTINYSDGTVTATILSAAYNGRPDERTMYVRKGMQFTIINTNSTVRFYPFVE